MLTMKAAFEVPEIYGLINKQIWENNEAKSNGTVVHIRDAHGSFEAQENMKQLISYLVDQYGFDTILLEGATAELHPELFHFFNDHHLNNQIAKRLVQSGELSGAEWYLIENPDKDITAKGIEDVTAYANNFKMYQSVMSEEKISNDFLRQLRAQIELVGSRTLNQKLRHTIRTWQAWRDERMSAGNYLKEIRRSAGEALHIDLTNPGIQLKYPMLIRYFKAADLETSLDQAAVQNEKERLIQFFTQQNVDESLLTPLYGWQVEKGLAGWTGDLPRLYLERLYSDAYRYGFSFDDYPELTKFLVYLILESELEAVPFFDEIEKLTDQILPALTTNPNEKQIIALIRQAVMLEKVLKLALTRREFSDIRADGGSLSPQSVAAQVEQLTKKEAMAGELTAKAEAIFQNAVKFYQGAEKRESFFVHQTLKAVAAADHHRVIVITGGYHSEVFEKNFVSHQMSYIEINPRMTSLEDVQSSYVDAMLGKRQTLFDRSYISLLRATMLPEDRRAIFDIAGHRTNMTREEYLGLDRLAQTVVDAIVREALDPEVLLTFNQSLFSGTYGIRFSEISYADPENPDRAIIKVLWDQARRDPKTGSRILAATRELLWVPVTGQIIVIHEKRAVNPDAAYQPRGHFARNDPRQAIAKLAKLTQLGISEKSQFAVPQSTPDNQTEALSAEDATGRAELREPAVEAALSDRLTSSQARQIVQILNDPDYNALNGMRRQVEMTKWFRDQIEGGSQSPLYKAVMPLVIAISNKAEKTRIQELLKNLNRHVEGGRIALKKMSPEQAAQYTFGFRPSEKIASVVAEKLPEPTIDTAEKGASIPAPAISRRGILKLGAVLSLAGTGAAIFEELYVRSLERKSIRSYPANDPQFEFGLAKPGTPNVKPIAVASLFREDRKINGLLIENGIQTNPYNPNSKGFATAKALFLILNDGSVRIIEAKTSFAQSLMQGGGIAASDVRDAFQAGPIAVINAQVNHRVEAWAKLTGGRKTVVGADARGNLHVRDFYGFDHVGAFGPSGKRVQKELVAWAKEFQIVEAMFVDSGTTHMEGEVPLGGKETVLHIVFRPRSELRMIEGVSSQGSIAQRPPIKEPLVKPVEPAEASAQTPKRRHDEKPKDGMPSASKDASKPIGARPGRPWPVDRVDISSLTERAELRNDEEINQILLGMGEGLYGIGAAYLKILNDFFVVEAEGRVLHPKPIGLQIRTQIGEPDFTRFRAALVEMVERFFGNQPENSRPFLGSNIHELKTLHDEIMTTWTKAAIDEYPPYKNASVELGHLGMSWGNLNGLISDFISTNIYSQITAVYSQLNNKPSGLILARNENFQLAAASFILDSISATSSEYMQALVAFNLGDEALSYDERQSYLMPQSSRVRYEEALGYYEEAIRLLEANNDEWLNYFFKPRALGGYGIIFGRVRLAHLYLFSALSMYAVAEAEGSGSLAIDIIRLKKVQKYLEKAFAFIVEANQLIQKTNRKSPEYIFLDVNESHDAIEYLSSQLVQVMNDIFRSIQIPTSEPDVKSFAVKALRYRQSLPPGSPADYNKAITALTRGDYAGAFGMFTSLLEEFFNLSRSGEHQRVMQTLTRRSVLGALVSFYFRLIQLHAEELLDEGVSAEPAESVERRTAEKATTAHYLISDLELNQLLSELTMGSIASDEEVAQVLAGYNELLDMFKFEPEQLNSVREKRMTELAQVVWFQAHTTSYIRRKPRILAKLNRWLLIVKKDALFLKDQEHLQEVIPEIESYLRPRNEPRAEIRALNQQLKQMPEIQSTISQFSRDAAVSIGVARDVKPLSGILDINLQGAGEALIEHILLPSARAEEAPSLILADYFSNRSEAVQRASQMADLTFAMSFQSSLAQEQNTVPRVILPADSKLAQLLLVLLADQSMRDRVAGNLRIYVSDPTGAYKTKVFQELLKRIETHEGSIEKAIAAHFFSNDIHITTEPVAVQAGLHEGAATFVEDPSILDQLKALPGAFVAYADWEGVSDNAAVAEMLIPLLINTGRLAQALDGLKAGESASLSAKLRELGIMIDSAKGSRSVTIILRAIESIYTEIKAQQQIAGSA